jgi:hypothetical protein
MNAPTIAMPLGNPGAPKQPSPPLKTAAEIATEETAPAAKSKTPLSDEFLAELYKQPTGVAAGQRFPVRHWPKQIRINGRMMEFTDSTVSLIVLQSDQPQLATDDELKQLRDLQSQMDTLLARFDEFSLTRVASEHQRLRQEADEKVKAGDFAGSFPSREAIHGMFIEKNKSISKALVELTDKQVVPLVVPILVRFEDAIAAFIRQIEGNDRTECAEWGIPYQPSALFCAACNIAIKYDAKLRLPSPENWGTPKRLLAGIVNL